MTRETFTIAAVVFLCNTATAAPQPPVTFESPCACRDNHGKARLPVKNDPVLPPTDTNAIQAVTPSDMFSWPGPGVRLTPQSKRTGIETNWVSLVSQQSQYRACCQWHLQAQCEGRRPFQARPP
jgi:hypothetical protein